MFNLTLPSGKEITFRSTSFRDRRLLAKKYNRNEGYLLEELMAAFALLSIDGNPVQEEWAAEPINRFDTWSIVDTQYYIEVYMSMNSIDDMARERAQEEAKKLMGAGTTQTSQVSGTKPKALKVNTGSTTNG